MANFLKRALRGLLPNLENPSVPLSMGLAAMGWGMPTDSNENVSELSALQVPTVLSCVRILSEGVGSLPLRVYEELDRGRRTAKSHPLYRLLSLEPNPNSTAVNLLSTAMVHAVLWENAYIEIERNAAGQPIGLYPRVPWKTKPVRQGVYETTDTGSGRPNEIRAADMLHVVGFSLDAQLGISLISQARQSVGLALAAARYGARFYANNARPGGVIELPAPLGPDDQARLKEDIERMSTGGNAYRLVVLAPGMKYNVVSLKPEESQYIETRKFEREEIAAVFRVPNYMVGGTDKALKSTIEAQNLEFLTYSLRPWIERFEQEFNRKLLPPVGRNAGKYTIKFYTDAIVKTDLAAQTTYFTAGRTGGWLSVNDIREQKDLEPIPGGDTYLQPLNMAPATTAADDVETDDEPATTTEEPADNTITRAKALYSPLLKDAFSRLQHRAKRDSLAIQQALEPICRSFGSYLRADSEAGQAEQKAMTKYLDGIEARSKNWQVDADRSEDEFRRLCKALVFAIEQDRAEARAKEVLKGDEH